MSMKPCSACGAVLEVCEENFYKSKKGKDGFINQCKSCRNQKIKERRTRLGEEGRRLESVRVIKWRREHPEYVLSYQKEWVASGRQNIANRKWRSIPENVEIARLASQRWRDENPEKNKESQRKYNLNYPEERAKQYKRHRLKKKYGISLPDFIAACEAQDQCCCLCHKEAEILTVDHDHACCPGNTSCGKCVRGLLCRLCNFMLGAAKDDPKVLHRAIEYLAHPPRLLSASEEKDEKISRQNKTTRGTM